MTIPECKESWTNTWKMFRRPTSSSICSPCCVATRRAPDGHCTDVDLQWFGREVFFVQIFFSITYSLAWQFYQRWILYDFLWSAHEKCSSKCLQMTFPDSHFISRWGTPSSHHILMSFKCSLVIFHEINPWVISIYKLIWIWTILCLTGKPTISMAMFNGFVTNYQGVSPTAIKIPWNYHKIPWHHRKNPTISG